MIIKKALIGLLVAGGAISLVACGKNNKKTTGTNTTASKTTNQKTTAKQTSAKKTTTGKTTQSQTEEKTINYTKDVDFSNLTEKKLSLRDQAKIQNATYGLSFTSAKGYTAQGYTMMLEGNLIKMKMLFGGDATVYSNDVAITKQSSEMTYEGNIPAELTYMMPVNMKSTGVNYVAATNNYVFRATKADNNYGSFSAPYLINNDYEIDTKSSNFSIQKDIMPYSLLEYVSAYGTIYEIDDKNFVLYDVEIYPGSYEEIDIYDPETKTSTSGYNNVIETTTTISYFSVKENGEYQLDYVYVKNVAMSEYVPYTMMSMPSDYYVKVDKSVEVGFNEFEFTLGYENNGSYKDKTKFINSFDGCLKLNSIQKNTYNSSFAKQSSTSCEQDILTNEGNKINLDFAATLRKGDIIDFSSSCSYDILNTKVLNDVALTSSENKYQTEGNGISFSVSLIDAIKNVDGIEIISDDKNEKYIKVTDIEDGYEYRLIINADIVLRKTVNTDNSVSYNAAIVVKSSELIKVISNTSFVSISSPYI